MDVLMHVFLLLRVPSILRADGTAKCNTGQRYTPTDVLCLEDVPLWCNNCGNVSGRLSNLRLIQTCTFLYLLQYTSICSVLNPDSALSHLKPHKHNSSSPGAALFVEASRCRTWQRRRMRRDASSGVSCQSQRFSTPIHSPSVPRLIRTFPLNIARARHSLLVVIYWCYYQVINCSILYKYEQNGRFSFPKPAAEEMFSTLKRVYSPRWCC